MSFVLRSAVAQYLIQNVLRSTIALEGINMRRVSMREANQNFSSLLAEVESGERLIVERRGVPVAEIIPFRRPAADRKADKAWAEMLAILEKGIPLGGVAPTKDEIYER